MCDSRECAGGTDYCCEIDCTQWSGFRTDGDWRPPMANRPCPLGDQCPSEECTGSTAADCGGGCTFIPAGSDPACVYTAGHDQQRLGLAAGGFRRLAAALARAVAEAEERIAARVE